MYMKYFDKEHLGSTKVIHMRFNLHELQALQGLKHVVKCHNSRLHLKIYLIQF